VRRRIGLVGFGFIGENIYRRIVKAPDLDVAFVYTRDPRRLKDVPWSDVLEDLDDFATREADLIVEMAHPEITRRHGEAFLRKADYMMLSVTALSDAALEARLTHAATEAGTTLYLPHGALVGCDSLFEWREQWDEVTITFRKHPQNIDFSESGIDPAGITKATTLYDGPVRGIARLFPRNVNTMATCALATVGLDRCRGVMVADPALDVAIAEVVAIGRDGSRLETTKRQPIVGVSGTELLESQFHSILLAAGSHGPLAFV
jgi:aspartate dehydrogenase